MARQRPTQLVMGPCIVEIDRIVIREVQYQLEVNRLKGNFGWMWPMSAGHPRVGNGAMHKVNRYRNEEIIVKGNFVWVWPILGGAPQAEIDRIVIKEVQYQLEVNRLKGNFGWMWPMSAGHPRVGNGAMHKVNRYRNEEIIVKGNFVWVWPILGGAPQAEIDRIVIKEVQYQLEVNRLKGNFGWGGLCGWGASGLVMGPCIVDIDRIVMHKCQYQFEVNRCRIEEILVKGNFGWVWSMWAGRPRIDRIVIREVQYQFEVNQCRNKEVNDGQTDGRTDRRTVEITTISLRFKKAWG
ncbi:hypothetical protein DPMN_134465 [Dreissena polymorpha]|uniref:Uncharacterized protein n=1 Tax=Dreissena polymorpha TaxID=45954 RepID=A0A9D4JBX5_DREPO|nr:hypothetical protein DPMN_134465 [Dreissena polymorpha]